MVRLRFHVRVLLAHGLLGGAFTLPLMAQDPGAPPALPELPMPEVAPQPPPAGAPLGVSEVRVSEYMTVDIISQGDDITNVLQKLAIESRRNIVPSRSVFGRINATIYGAPFKQALDGLLHPYGFAWLERDEFIYVYTEQELAQLEMMQRAPVSRIIYLDYLRAADAALFVSHLLSQSGKIEATHDEDAGGQGGGGLAEVAGASVDRDEAVYTPNTDEYALTNAVIIHDFPDHVERIERFLRELDTRPAQVLLEVTVVQTELTEANAFGVDFALMTGVDFTEFFNFPTASRPISLRTAFDASGNVVSPAFPQDEGFVVSDAGNTGAGPATVRAGAIFGDHVGVFLRALDEVADTTLLANPKVLALNRQRAKILVGVKVGYLETVVVENQILQTVEFIDTGIALDIRPFILKDGRIRMELAPKVSQVTFRETEGVSGFSQQIPDEALQTVETDVLVPNGYTAVIGGLFREDVQRSRRQVPVLGDIPLAGAAFRGHDDMLSQFEVIFLVKPTILEDQRLNEMGDDGLRYQDRVRVGSRLGLLPWSRERHSSRLNLTARRLAAEGRYDAAMWHIRRSLEMHPIQPEAVRIREALVGDPLWWPTRSMVARIVDQEFQEGDFPFPVDEEVESDGAYQSDGDPADLDAPPAVGG